LLKKKNHLNCQGGSSFAACCIPLDSGSSFASGKVSKECISRGNIRYSLGSCSTRLPCVKECISEKKFIQELTVDESTLPPSIKELFVPSVLILD
jgi:hypothetical protein